MKVEQFSNDLLTSGYHYTPRSNKTGHVLVVDQAPARDNRKAITFSAVLVQPISCPRDVVADAPKKPSSRGRARGCEGNDSQLARRRLRRTPADASKNCQIVARAKSWNSAPLYMPFNQKIESPVVGGFGSSRFRTELVFLLFRFVCFFFYNNGDRRGSSSLSLFLFR